MKREDLTKLGIDEALVDKIMALHGSDVEAHKAKLTTAQAETDAIKAQLAEAGKQIEAFKGMDIDGIKKAADEYKAAAEKAQADAAAQVAQLRFDHALDGALTGAKAKNAKAVKALLDMNGLKFNDADGSIVGLSEQLAKVKESADYLFESDTKTPTIVTGGNSQTVITDKLDAVMRQSAGLPVK